MNELELKALRARNVKTALIVAAVATLLFFGIILRTWMWR